MGPHSYSANAQAFLALKSRVELAFWLGISDRKLRFLLYVLDPNKKYTTFHIKKRNGGFRLIDAPNAPLKSIQRKLAQVISEVGPASGIAKGYVSGASVIDHAWVHRRRKNIVLADLKDFFPSITFARVRGALLAKPFNLPSPVATCIAQICCKDGVLPQGAPTSPTLSNLICRSLDHRLVSLAKSHRVSVSRYADDICFSTSLKAIPSEIATLVGDDYFPGPALVAAVDAAGFALNPSKFKVKSHRTQQLVTGLVVNRGVALPRRWKRQLRVLLHLVEKHGSANAREVVKGWAKRPASRGGAESIEQVIRGKTHFAQYIDFRGGRKFSESIYRNYSALRRLMPRPLDGVSFRVMAEGKTDLLHLEAALRWFQLQGKFGEFRPRFVGFPGETGDIELLKTLERIAKAEISELTIGIFDYDNPKFMKKEGLGMPGAFRQLGSRVYAASLGASPAVLGSNFCIELLYPKAQLVTPHSSGRRIFLPDEFDSSTGLSLCGLYKRKYPKSSTLIVSDQVERISDGYSCLLSKTELAQNIKSGEPPFDDMDFSGFEETFFAIRRVIEDAYG